MKVILIVIKNTRPIELGKDTLCRPERPQNHNSKQEKEQQKETEIEILEISS